MQIIYTATSKVEINRVKDLLDKLHIQWEHLSNKRKVIVINVEGETDDNRK